jgi:hypothetical protein
MDLQTKLQELVKAINAGTYNVAPDALRQGPALGIEDCSPLYHNQTFEEKHIFLQKDLSIKKAKGPTVQFIRRLSYGRFGGSAQLEGAVGRERTSDWTRVAVPMCYYSEIRRVTVPAMMMETQGGDKVEDLEAEGGQLNLAGDIEFDLMRGCDDFSNAGVFDGNPNAIPALANIRGLQLQIRQSDSQLLANDLMFLAYGAGLSSSVQIGGVLTQDSIEDMSVRSAMNQGSADVLLVDPLVQSAYNKLGFAKERINLAGSPQEMTGSDLRRQSTYNGMIQVKASRFLAGKFQPHLPADGAPGAPSIAIADAAGTTTFQAAQVYTYYVTGENENGEGAKSTAVPFTVTGNAKQIQVTITPSATGTSRFFNVYRSAAGGTSATARFIGRVVNSGGLTTVFYDLANKIPGFVTGVMVQYDTMWIAELAPYSRMKLAVSDLSVPEAHFRFLTLCVGSPKKNVLGENLRGAL